MRNSIAILLLLVVSGMNAQSFFLATSESFSVKDSSILNMKNGDRLVGQIVKAKATKGLITEIVLKIEGTKKTIHASDMSSIFLAKFDKKTIKTWIESKTSFDKLFVDLPFEVERNEYFDPEYFYYENHLVEFENGDKVEGLLLLLNPFFCSRIKVFEDPRASKTTSTSFNVGLEDSKTERLRKQRFPGRKDAVRVDLFKTEGLDKAFFIKKGDSKVYRIKKKEFKKQAEELFDGCDSVLGDDSNYSWLKFDKYILKYTTECK